MRFSLWAVLALLVLVAAWTKEDHEIFRLKDELETLEEPGMTFYDYLGVPSSATIDDIAKAYRKKGKTMHPDKAKQAFIASRATSASKKARSSSRSAASKAGPAGGKASSKPNSAGGKASSKAASKAPKPTARAVKPPTERELRAVTKKATEDFTRLGLINKILQGPDRARYDHFLANGFPAWRGTGYYYERYRPGAGTVVFGLFIFAGGAVHYVVLILGWKRQRDFVQRYIRQARTLAWGDASPVAGIPGISEAGESTGASTAVTQQTDDSPDGPAQTLNRRERRAQEKSKKKPSAKDRRKGATDSGTATPANEPAEGTSTPPAAGSIGPAPGPRKRVHAENGKILVVDSVGNVFLEEIVHDGDADSDDEGHPQLFLLDTDEMPRPTLKDTLVYKLPGWVIRTLKERVRGAGEDEAGEADVPAEGGRRKKVPRKPRPDQIGEVVDPAPVGGALAVPGLDAGGVASGSSSVSGDDEVDGFVTVGEAVGASAPSGKRKKKAKNRR